MGKKNGSDSKGDKTKKDGKKSKTEGDDDKQSKVRSVYCHL